MFWIWFKDNLIICGVSKKGDNLFFINLWMLILMCFNVRFKVVVVFVCFKINCFKRVNLFFIEFIEWWSRLVRVIVLLWFFLIVFMILLNWVLIVEMKEDKCFFWIVIVLVILILLWLRSCIWCCKVLILFEVVVLKRDLEIWLIKLNIVCLDLEELMNWFWWGIWDWGIRVWILWIVELIFVIVWVFKVFSVLIICLLYLYCGVLL